MEPRFDAIPGRRRYASSADAQRRGREPSPTPSRIDVIDTDAGAPRTRGTDGTVPRRLPAPRRGVESEEVVPERDRSKHVDRIRSRAGHSHAAAVAVAAEAGESTTPGWRTQL